VRNSAEPSTEGCTPAGVDHAVLFQSFSAEKQESVLFVVVAILAVAASVWLWRRGARYRAMAYPMAAIALIQLTVGCSVWERTDRKWQSCSSKSNAIPPHFEAPSSPA